jgi:hypothetical protein
LTTPRVLFLGGSGRSGSTLIERLTGELPGVCAIGEAVHLWERGVRDNEPCGCGLPLLECPFWRKVGDDAFGGWASFDTERMLALKAAVDRNRFIPELAAPRLRGSLARDVTAYVDAYRRLYTSVARISGASVIVDSSKHASLAHALRWCDGLDLRVLQVVRDPRAVAYSWTKEMRRNAGAEMDTFSPRAAANLWTVMNAGFHLLAARGATVRRGRYEDFIAAPVAGVRGVAEFAGLPVGDGDLGFMTDDSATLTVAHTASGNPMRFVTGKIALRRDEAWRSALPAADRRLVTSLTLPLLLRYGYVPARTA